MWILIISLIALAVVAAIAGIVRNRKLQKKIDNGELDAMPEVQEVDIECCGQHEVCEKESLLAAVRSLQLRGIALPDNIKDEVFLIVGERRENH